MAPVYSHLVKKLTGILVSSQSSWGRENRGTVSLQLAILWARWYISSKIDVKRRALEITVKDKT